MDKFDSLTLREKVMVIVMCALIVLFILWQFIFTPLRQFHNAAEQAQTRAQNDRAYIEKNISLINLAAAPKGREPFSRRELLEMTRRVGIERVSRIQPQPNGDIKVWIDDVLSEQIFSLVQNIDAQYATRVTGAQISRQEGGLISAQMSFAVTLSE